MRRIIDQIQGYPTGKSDGAVVPSMMRMPHLAGKDGMYPMMMASLYTNGTLVMCISFCICKACNPLINYLPKQ